MKNITESQWYAHPSYQADLAKIMADPVMETALQVAFDKCFQPIPALANPGGDLVDYFAVQGAVREGCRLAFEKLRQLTRPKTKVMKPEEKPWETTPAKPAV